ncbi:MAG: beta-ketoacyl synthase N-terminal-like domain-containing protein [Bacteroidota bacterium]
MIRIFINGLGNVSPQETAISREGLAPASAFLDTPRCYETNRMKCIDPDYKAFIPAEQLRRMGRIIKMGIAAARLCMNDAGAGPDNTQQNQVSPDAIITGTGLGCLEDTEKFLTSMIKNREEFLTPTSFIQSTHNTVAGQIALQLRCHNYNFTYVHRGISFESALTDAITQMQLGEISNALAGGADELTSGSFEIMSRLGFWKQKPISTLNLLDDHQRGTIAGEGASFVFLENEQRAHTYAELRGVTTFLKPATNREISLRLHEFLARHELLPGNIDLVLAGLNGDPRSDLVYHDLIETDFPNTPLAFFKHLCGEYPTATAFAVWLASMILKTRTVPEATRINHPPDHLRHILIYNHFRENNHAFILLSQL